MLGSSNGFRGYWSIHKICVEITVMLAHWPDEGPNPVNCSTCSCAQLICACKYARSFGEGVGTCSSQGKGPHLDVYCLLKISLVCKRWLHWPPDWCLWLKHEAGLLVLSCLPGPSSGDLGFGHILQRGSVCDLFFSYFSTSLWRFL